MNQPNLQSTEAILAEMATIKTMERGKLIYDALYAELSVTG